MTPDDELLCWGYNGNGQIGIEESVADPVTTPSTISLGGTEGNVADIGLGHFHICAFSSKGNTGYCWGGNQNGEIGNPNFELGSQTAEPTEVALSDSLASIHGGWQKTCARRTDGRIYCWGANGNESSDKFGVGDTSADIRTPTGIGCP